MFRTPAQARIQHPIEWTMNGHMLGLFMPFFVGKTMSQTTRNGKRLHHEMENYPQIFHGKISTISMGHGFHSYVNVYQRVPIWEW